MRFQALRIALGGTPVGGLSSFVHARYQTSQALLAYEVIDSQAFADHLLRVIQAQQPALMSRWKHYDAWTTCFYLRRTN